MIVFSYHIIGKYGIKEAYKAKKVIIMNSRGFEKFRNVEELWDRELEEEFSHLYTINVMEDFQDK